MRARKRKRVGARLRIGLATPPHLESDVVHRVGREVARRHYPAVAAARVAAQHMDLVRRAVDLVVVVVVVAVAVVVAVGVAVWVAVAVGGVGGLGG